jgi:Leucine-rich repeat (LRR) protein
MFYITFDNENAINFTLNEWDNLPFHNIKTISFHNNGLRELPNLNQLINLQKLYCYHNQLTSLPNLDQLINLEELWCNNNQLRKLPNLDKLINLEELWCNNNQLTSLPNLDHLINLEWLCCKNNQLTSLPITIRKCKKLDYYKKKYDINDYEYIDNLPYEVNENIEQNYYKPVINYYNSKYL